MKGIFSVLVENKDGVLSGVSGLFARRGYNIDRLAVGETEQHDVSSMTIVSTGDTRTIDQIEKQLNKQVDLIKVRRLEENRCISLEMMLIRVSYTPTNRGGLIEICNVMGAKIMQLPDADTLTPGKLADMILIDLQQPNMQPIHDIPRNLVYSGSKSNVIMTMINGKDIVSVVLLQWQVCVNVIVDELDARKHSISSHPYLIVFFGSI